MADNTCHFGLNNLFADNGLEEGDSTRLYFPADAGQMRACVRAVFAEEGFEGPVTAEPGRAIVSSDSSWSCSAAIEERRHSAAVTRRSRR